MFALLWLSVISGTRAELALTNSNSSAGVLVVDTSSMSIAGGKATLTIGPLQRVRGGYSGEYRVSVFPYVFKNEKGKLAITASDEDVVKLEQGKSISITGTATTIGKTGKTRRIDAIATPADGTRGKLKLWFVSEDRKMIFEPSYRFADAKTVKGPTAKIPAQDSGSAP
jgi:hypothetical protein